MLMNRRRRRSNWNRCNKRTTCWAAVAHSCSASSDTDTCVSAHERDGLKQGISCAAFEIQSPADVHYSNACLQVDYISEYEAGGIIVLVIISCRPRLVKTCFGCKCTMQLFLRCCHFLVLSLWADVLFVHTELICVELILMRVDLMYY